MSDQNQLIVIALIICFVHLSNQTCIQKPGFTLKGHVEDFVEVNNLNECFAACDKHTNCRSGIFNEAGPFCVLNGATRNTHPDDFQESDNEMEIYFEGCANRKTGSSHLQHCFSERNKVLIGSTVDVVEDVKSLQDCVQECKQNNICRSATYMQSEHNCLINTGTKAQDADSYFEEQNAVYFEKCDGKVDPDFKESAPNRNKPKPQTRPKPSKNPAKCTCKEKDETVKRNLGNGPSRRNDGAQRDTPLCRDTEETSICEKMKSLGLCVRRRQMQELCSKTCDLC